MKNLLYFAVYGLTGFRLPEIGEPAYGGFGFSPDGTLRIPYAPPKNSVIIFDDSTVPKQPDMDALCSFCAVQEIRTVIFDLERQSSKLFEAMPSVPFRILVRPYRPTEPFELYLKRIKTEEAAAADLCPISGSLCGRLWRENKSASDIGGHYSQVHQCMYRVCHESNGTVIRFYDTKMTVRKRAEASGLPCLLPLREYESLPER